MPWPETKVSDAPCARCGVMTKRRSFAKRFCLECSKQIALEKKRKYNREVRLPALREVTRKRELNPDYSRYHRQACAICGNEFTPHSGNQIRCNSCNHEYWRKYYRERARKENKTHEQHENKLRSQNRRRGHKRWTQEKQTRLKTFRALFTDAKERSLALQRDRRHNPECRRKTAEYKRMYRLKMKEENPKAFELSEAKRKAKKRSPAYKIRANMRCAERYYADKTYREKILQRRRQYHINQSSVRTLMRLLTMANALANTTKRPQKVTK